MALWYGDTKPHFNFFFYKMRSDIERLFRGVPVVLPAGNIITVRGVILMGTCDLPAKCDVLNFIQFNGQYGCPCCQFPGENVRTGPRSALHVYPYVENFEERTSALCIEYANEARRGVPVFGVKGHTALSRLMPDFIRGMCLDRMHAVDGGVMKKLLTLWCSPAYSTYPFSLTRQIAVINTRLMSIKPLKFVHRMPRSVEDLVHWKAAELKMFLFHYSVPILTGILDDEYLKNFQRLLVAIAILSRDKMTGLMIDVAEDLLHRFVKEFEDLYGTQFCSINIHLLLHLSSCVRNLGPLWLYTCYEYEDLNGHLLKLIHRTWHLESQIVTSHNQIIKMSRHIERLPEGKVRDFCLRKKNQVKIIELVQENTYSVGTYKYLPDISEIIDEALRNCNIDSNLVDVWSFLRLLKNKKLYLSQLYRNDLQHLSSVIQYSENDTMKYGMVHNFVKLINNQCAHHDCDCQYIYYAIINEIICDRDIEVNGNNYRYSTASFLYQCRETNNLKAIPIESITTPCTFMNIENENYLAIPINSIEVE